ncbi:MAG: hypothetical protein PF637_01180, partial [Spirochaetes bacterium]|nr:hypothetical protein [Spirochaetota bacterium]
MKNTVKKRLRTIGLALALTVITVIFRQLFSIFIYMFGLPTAMHPIAVWFLIFVVLWAPRLVFYMPLLVSEAVGLMILYLNPELDNTNAYTGIILNLLMVILVAEVFRYSFKRIKRVNQKLIEERERADLATKRKDV